MEDDSIFPSRSLKEESILFQELKNFMNPLLTLIESGSCEGNEHILVIPPNRHIETLANRFHLHTRGSTHRVVKRVPQSVVRRHLMHGSNLSNLWTLTGDSVEIRIQNSENDASIGTLTLHANNDISIAVKILWKEPFNENIWFSVVFTEEALVDTSGTNLHQHRYQHIESRLWARLSRPIDTDFPFLIGFFKRDEYTLRSYIEKLVEQKIHQEENVNMYLQRSLDEAMLNIDTEVAVMSLSYICMPGFEHLILAKINQIIKMGVESVACGDHFSEDEKEDVLVSLHTIVTGALGAKLATHWDEMMQRENVALNHACHTLELNYSFKYFLPESMKFLSEVSFANEIELVKTLENNSLSILSLMRVMECTLGALTDKITVCGCTEDSSADVCIALLVALLISSTPTVLPSRIRYAREFTLLVMSLSSIGYALTTFEAATAQIMEEYRLYVTSGVCSK